MASFLRRLGGRSGRRVAVIGVDGVPYSYASGQIAAGRLPGLGRLAREGSLARMTSVYPWVSSVAWTSCATGCNPAKHNMFGFVDRDPATYRTFIPTARDIRRPMLWDLLSRAGKQVVVINVPVTYPPEPVNGVLIADFLSPSLDKAVYPPSLLPTLERLDYRVDVDPWIAYESLDRMMSEIEVVLERRLAAIEHFLKSARWDFFMAVIMETDRLHHFFWSRMEERHPVYAPFFERVYRRVDEAIAGFARALDDDTTLVVMSDHGFCSIKQEVFYNHWLHDRGWLTYANNGPKELREIADSSVAYSLDPGRIFIRVRGRERNGVVAPGAEYEALRGEIAAAAEELRDPATGARVVRRAYRREELYAGPYLDSAADLILAPVDGYDPKGALHKESLTRKDPVMVGMHTYDDATLCVRGHHLARPTPSIVDVAPTVLRLMGVPIPEEMDGTALVT